MKMRCKFLATLALCAFASAATAGQDDRTISVTGSGSASAAPDMARATLGVEARRAEAAEAVSAASAAMSAIIASLRDAGVAERDIRTVEIGLNPSYSRPDNNAPLRLEGYIASQRVIATVRALDRLGPVLDAAVGAGATDFGGVSFDIAGREALEDAARRAAVTDAARIAGQLAEAAGVNLGAPQPISLGSYGPMPLREMAVMKMDAASTPVAPGEMTLNASVSVVYAIE
jgi:uncharacterized protein YggE